MRVVVISGVYLVSPLVVVSALLIIRGDGPSASGVLALVYLALVVEFVSWVLATLPAIRRGHADTLSQLVATTGELAQVRARSEVRLLKEKQRLAAIVHGDIQSTLMATALMLQRPRITPAEVSQLIDEAREKISAVLLHATSVDEPRTLEQVVEGLQQAWEGIVAIKVTIEPSVHEQVAQQADLGETLWQVCREAIANAVKHGKASRISISLRHDSHTGHLVCDVADNGHARDDATYRGGGSRLFSAVADSHQRVGKGQRTILTLHLPLASTSLALPIRSS